ncbi:MAG TPA: AI-2E family transporter [Gammaproteobacteria bacterium]|nr:AI-2E family transporter [Gammaproteobacteria bacterium]
MLLDGELSKQQPGATGDPGAGHPQGSLPQPPWEIRSVMLTGIFLMLLLYTLRIAAPLFVPIALAVLLSLLLSPLVRRLARWRVPDSVGAALVMMGLVAMVGGAFYLLATPAQEWLAKAPETMTLIEHRLSGLKEPMESMQAASERVQDLATIDNGRTVQSQTLTVRPPGLLDNLLSGTTRLAAATGLVFFLLFFLLASGDGLLLKLVKLGRSLDQKKRVVGVMRDIQSDISRYLVTVTAVNIGLGLVTALALHALGVPNPVLWGALVSVLNFAPYIGAAVSLVVLTFVGLMTFESMGLALLVPLTFFVLTTLEGQVITPIILGRRLALSAVVVFLSVIVCGWMWGIIGALLAVPLVASLRIVCGYVEPLQPIAELLGAEDREDA